MISDELILFIENSIHSVGELELLLLLRSQSTRHWSASSATRELRGEVDSVRQRLSALHNAGLLERSGDCEPEYRYAPNTPQLAAVTEELARAYEVRRCKVIDLIYSKPASRGLVFAQAFDLTKKKETHDG